MSTNRRHFTKYGFHLNNHGKEWIAKQIALQIELLVKSTSKANSAIPLKWDEETTNLNTENKMMSTEIDTVECLILTAQTLSNQNIIINNKSIRRIFTSNKKSSHHFVQRFYMVDLNVSRSKKLTNSQCRMKLNDKVISSAVRHIYGNKNDDKNYSLIIYHQNIHGLKGKINEFMRSIVSEMPQLICLSEHHLKYNETDFAYIPAYKLGAKYCRTSLKCGGVCIFVHKNVKFSNINLLKYCKEQDLENAAVKLKFAIKMQLYFVHTGLQQETGE